MASSFQLEPKTKTLKLSERVFYVFLTSLKLGSTRTRVALSFSEGFQLAAFPAAYPLPHLMFLGSFDTPEKSPVRKLVKEDNIKNFPNGEQ